MACYKGKRERENIEYEIFACLSNFLLRSHTPKEFNFSLFINKFSQTATTSKIYAFQHKKKQNNYFHYFAHKSKNVN